MSQPDQSGAPLIFQRGFAAGPVYLHRDDDGWHAAQRPAQAALDPRTIAECLVQGYVSPPDTMHPDDVALRPGEHAEVAADGELICWRDAVPEPVRGGLRPVLTEILAELGEPRVGVLLSGGVDSAWLAALAARRRPTEAYTTVFSNLQQVDYAADAAQQAGVSRQVVEGDGRLVWAWLKLVRETGLPQPDLGGAAVMMAAQAAVDAGCPTLLSGLGADEVSGGRPALIQPSSWSMRRLPRLPFHVEDARQAYGLVPPRYVEWAAALRLRAELLDPDLLQREPYLVSVPPAPPVDPAVVRQTEPAVGGWLFEHSGRLGAAMLPTIAATERLTGARILLPYLDPRAVSRGLAEYGPNKPAIRSGSKAELPDQIRNRPKLVRVRPEAHWLLGEPLPDCVAEAFTPQALAASGWFDPVTVHHWLQVVRERPFTPLNRLRTRLLVTAAAIQILAQDA